MELVKINPSDYGLEEQKAKEISDMFKPMLDKMVDLEKQYNEVVNLEIKPETCKKAKELRLEYVKIRTGTATIHKELKAFYLQGGRFVDGWKNAQLMASQGIEEKLINIEKHYENIEKERIAKLQEEREAELEKYEIEFMPENLGEMKEEVWNNYLSGTKINYEKQKAAKKKAEEDRIKMEKEARAEQERIRKENEKLKKEAEELEKKKRKETEEYEAKLKAEREEREQIESELRAKKEAEEKAEKEKLEKLESELKKRDETKITDLIFDLETLKTKYQFKSRRNKRLFTDICSLLDKVINHIKSNT